MPRNFAICLRCPKGDSDSWVTLSNREESLAEILQQTWEFKCREHGPQQGIPQEAMEVAPLDDPSPAPKSSKSYAVPFPAVPAKKSPRSSERIPMRVPIVIYGFAGKPINDDGYAHGDALAGARGFLCRDSGERNGIRFGGFWRGARIVERGDFHGFLGNALLGAVLATLEFPSLLEDFCEGFLAVGESDPGVAVSFRAPEANGEVPRHESSLRNLMIPARSVEGRGPVEEVRRKVNGRSGCRLRQNSPWAL